MQSGSWKVLSAGARVIIPARLSSQHNTMNHDVVA